MRFTVNRIGRLIACCLTVVALAHAENSPPGQDSKIEGVITARNGADMTVRTASGDVVVALTDATEVKEKQGKLGLRKKQAAVMGLIPGLKVDVRGTDNPKGGLTATSVSFSATDLETAQVIQAGLNPTQKQLAATTGQAAANKQAIQGNQQAIQANQQQIATVGSAEADLAKRFGELGDYDVKHEATVFFDAGKADVSATAKSNLDRVATQAKALNGYLLEVEGFADSSGNAALNEKLSLERSQAVVDYLTENGGISPLHLLAPSAMGTTQPFASNETAAGRAENRRVVVKVLINRGLAKQ
jgi:outer membrane protein OmpA-like peptidoglycan-associated protein